MASFQKNHYEALEVAPTAPAAEIKRAFRQQIARYHPDKVQHLGKEFQEMAAGRAAELTEAYRILSNDTQRAEYDRLLALAAPSPSSAVTAPVAASTPPTPEADTPAQPRATYTDERAHRDQFVRRAAMERIRQAVAVIGNDYDETQVRGFDLALVPKPKLFGAKRPQLLGRFIEPVDSTAVADAWSLAAKAVLSSRDEVCVLLLGLSVAPARELALAIAEQIRTNRGANVTLVPVNMRTWDAHIPVDAPGVCKDLITRLRRGA